MAELVGPAIHDFASLQQRLDTRSKLGHEKGETGP
jgi:hypothetical protein